MSSPAVSTPRFVRPLPKKKHFGPASKCKSRCPRGGECCLNGSVPHTLHICGNDCPCHSAQRYAEAKRLREASHGNANQPRGAAAA